jgi:fermentation-respiration switch protein FrsA (DUF1100 family)
LLIVERGERDADPRRAEAGLAAYAPSVDQRTRAWVKRWIVGDLSWRRLGTSAVLIYGSLCAMGLLMTDVLLYQPHAAGYEDGPRVLKLTTRRGTRISARLDAVKDARFTVIFSHGNAEDIADGDWFAHRWNALGVSVVSYDYDGYGTSEGKPSERALYADIDAVYAYVTGTLAVPAERVLLYGRSLGGGPTVDLATRKPVGAVILESTFMSVFRIPFRVRVLPWDVFDNLAKIPTLRCPLLVLHGTEDKLIPLAHGRALVEAAPSPKRFRWVTGAGHAEVPFVAGALYDADIRDLLVTLAPPPP